jgi:hypothetical protein
MVARPRVAVTSVARLLDQTRELIVQAVDRGERPQYLVVQPSLYEAVARAKAREISFGRPLRVLGLLLVRSEDPEIVVPRVR